MNISNALKYLYPNADPLCDWIVQDDGNGAYIAAWHLLDPQPTLAQLQAASDAYDAAQAQADAEAAALRAQVINMAQSTVGTLITALTANQVRALVAVLLHKNGALDKDGKVRPLVEWAR